MRFSKPRARIHYAEQVVVSTYNGKPTLMIRIGNGRPNILNDMKPRITALVKETTLENHSFRKSHDLKLVQTWYAIFALTLTIMHVIDETSPLYGMDRQAMIEGEVRLFLSLEARDPALSSLVHDLHPYEAEKIFFGMRYAETIRRDPEGRAYVDHDLLGVIEPDSI